MRDLNKLSTVATRILSTPDIYDVANLMKPGTCGEYAVFLKSKITHQLMPFVAKLSDGTVAEILYQNPRKAIDKERDREEICSQLTTSMLRTVSIVMACLGSIQIARSTGVAPAAPPAIQRGGAMSDVIGWLITAGYLSPTIGTTVAKGTRLQLITRHARAGTPKFYLTFTDTRDSGGLYHATLTAESVPSGPEMPSGGLKLNFTNPIDVPGKTEKILPIRVTDNVGIPWMVGILCRDKFETLNAASAKGGAIPEDMWEYIFVRATGVPTSSSTPYYETRAELTAANDIFNQFRRTNDPRIILNATEQYLANVLGYFPGYADIYGPAGGAGGAPPLPMYDAFGRPIPYPGPGVGGVGGIIPRYPLPGAGAGARPYGMGAVAPPALPLGAPRPVPVVGATAGAKYDIPLPAGKYITDTLTAFRNAIPTLASPAAIRAQTLMVNVSPDRIIQTGVCTDPYWTQANLGRIYPWLTLQFLCIDKWQNLTAERRTVDDLMAKTWSEDFLEKLFTLYNSTYEGIGPRLTTNKGLLGEIKFEGIPAIKICKDPALQRVRNIELIQKGLVELHDLYDDHVRKMWDILNSLIVVIQLPDSGTEMVRIHPQVFKSGKSSMEYIEEKSKIARKEIIEFYLAVESAYLKTVASITPKT